MGTIASPLESTNKFIRQKSQMRPKVGIILGSGLDSIARDIDVETAAPYSSLPHVVSSHVEGHAGEFLLGRVSGCEVAVLNGRSHFYEGYSFEEITYPVRVLWSLGVRFLFITAAVGSLKKQLKVGDIVLLKDHLNAMGGNPLRCSQPGRAM